MNLRLIVAGLVMAACSILHAADSKELLGDPKPLVGAVPKPKLNQAAMDKLGLQLGCQAYTFREMSLFETIDVLHYLGIHNVELFPNQAFSKEKPKVHTDHNMSPELIAELIAKLKAADVKAVSYGVYKLDGVEAKDRPVFEWARKVGIKTIVSEPKVDKGVFDVIENLAKEYDINVAMHDHPKPSTYWDPKTVLQVCEGRSKLLGSCADVGHWVRSGLVPVECIKMLKGRVIEGHLKDVKPAGAAGKFEDTIWGTGVADAKGIMAELQRQGAKGVIFNIEYESSHGTELVANVAKCCENFSKFAEELTAGK